MARKDCPHCGGTGWKVVEREGARVAVRCECSAADRVTQALDRARIPPKYERCFFDNPTYSGFDTRGNGTLEQAKVIAQAFARD